MVPSGAAQLLILVSLVMPGFVFQAARLRFRGQPPDERDQFSRTLRALGVSVAFGIVYFAFFSSIVQSLLSAPAIVFDRPFTSAASAFVLIFLIPIAVAWVDLFVYWRINGRNDGLSRGEAIWRAFIRITTPAGYGTYSVTPSAWDHAARIHLRHYLRVQYADKIWLGGYMGESGFVNATPNSLEVYLEEAWHIDSGGEFVKPIKSTEGIWINCNSAIAVEYLSGGDSATSVARREKEAEQNGRKAK